MFALLQDDRWRKPLNAFGLLLCVAAAAFAIRFWHGEWTEHKQHQHRLRLFEEATISARWTGTEGESRAIAELAADPSKEAKQMLIDLAAHPHGLTNQSQRVAIQQLGKRNDPAMAAFLASLITPETSLDARTGAAEALQSMKCNAQCTRSLLEYLSRIDRGDLNVEEREVGAFGPELANFVGGQNRSQEQTVYSSLYAILSRYPDITLQVLTQSYAIGTSTPQPFAIRFAAKANMPALCPALLETQRKVDPSETARHVSISDAIRSLHCKPN